MRNWCHVFALHFVWQLWRSFVFFLEKFFFTHFPQIFSFRSECIVCAVCPLCDKSFHFFLFLLSSILFFLFRMFALVKKLIVSEEKQLLYVSWEGGCQVLNETAQSFSFESKRDDQIVNYENSAMSDCSKGKKEFASKTHSRCSRFFFGFYSFLLSVDSRLMINDVLTFFVVLFLQRVFLCWNNSTERIDSLLVCKVLCFSC
jgi:hypothetical protein